MSAKVHSKVGFWIDAFDPKDGKVSFSTGGQASLALAQASCGVQAYIPGEHEFDLIRICWGECTGQYHPEL